MTSNSQLPYEFCKESDWNYSFITISGVKYIAYFVDYSVYHPDFDEVYTFSFEPEESTPHPIDPKIAATIVTILQEFFQSKERAMILVCDNIDGKENKRNSRECLKRFSAKSPTKWVIQIVGMIFQTGSRLKNKADSSKKWMSVLFFLNNSY